MPEDDDNGSASTIMDVISEIVDVPVEDLESDNLYAPLKTVHENDEDERLPPIKLRRARAISTEDIPDNGVDGDIDYADDEVFSSTDNEAGIKIEKEPVKGEPVVTCHNRRWYND